MFVDSVAKRPYMDGFLQSSNNSRIQNQNTSGIYAGTGSTVNQGQNVSPDLSKFFNSGNTNTDLKPETLLGGSFKSSENNAKIETILSEKSEQTSKLEYDSVSDKGSKLSLDYQILETGKNEKTNFIYQLNQRKDNLNSQTSLLSSQKSNFSIFKNSLERNNIQVQFDISNISSQIGELQAQLEQVKASVSVGSSVINIESSGSVAVDTSQAVTQNSSAAGAVGETQNSSSIQKEVSEQVSEQTAKAEQLNNEIAKRIEDQINSLQLQLAYKTSLQKNYQANISYHESEEDRVDQLINEQETNYAEFENKIAAQQSSLPELEDKMQLKKVALDANSYLAKTKQTAFNRAKADSEQTRAKMLNANLLLTLNLKKYGMEKNESVN